MSWLFPALIPVLLMLGTFGLERLESALGGGATADAIDELVAQTPARADRPAPRVAVAAAAWSSRVAPHSTFTGLAALDAEPGLPTRVCRREATNPQFQPTRHANPV